MDTMRASGVAVVARFVDGRVLKGTTHDFSPSKEVFHLHGVCDASARGLLVPLASLKAVFFVKTYDGNARHVENLDVAGAAGQGRRIIVTFMDDEVVAGFTTGYAKDKQGFFVVPADPRSNNARIYVVTAAVKTIAWAECPAAKLGA
ncbi:MAG TPA: hypothetical protein VFV19_05720 [Candidatus Polarisedimenticolaceae bacterium]|nr:hypothetical protein [Candidatus Polarisedimenticolaceae bacterium]